MVEANEACSYIMHVITNPLNKEKKKKENYYFVFGKSVRSSRYTFLRIHNLIEKYLSIRHVCPPVRLSFQDTFSPEKGGAFFDHWKSHIFRGVITLLWWTFTELNTAFFWVLTQVNIIRFPFFGYMILKFTVTCLLLITKCVIL